MYNFKENIKQKTCSSYSPENYDAYTHIYTQKNEPRKEKITELISQGLTTKTNYK